MGERRGRGRLWGLVFENNKERNEALQFLNSRGVLLLPGPGARAWTWDLVSLQDERSQRIPGREVHDAGTLLAGMGGLGRPWHVSPQRGGDPTVSSISGQEKQQNVVAEVSAQPFPTLPITLISSRYVSAFSWSCGENSPGPCVWGGGQAGARCAVGETHSSPV